MVRLGLRSSPTLMMASILTTRRTSTSTTRSSSQHVSSSDWTLLNHCLVCYGFDPERRRRIAAKELARQLLQERDREGSE